MTRAYANLGRPLSSRAGSVPKVANCSTVPRRLYGLAGQPGMFTMGLLRSTSETPTAPVGFGAAEGMPPQDAQEPMAMTAAARPAISFVNSTAVLSAIRQKLPSSLSGMAPSITQMNLPSFSFTALWSAASAWWPAAAIKVSV